jgi:hypothetical protein
MHFGHLRQANENEQIDKSMTDTWKLFQKNLSDAADFVAQQTLIIKERLRDTFEVKYYEKILKNRNIILFFRNYWLQLNYYTIDQQVEFLLILHKIQWKWLNN